MVEEYALRSDSRNTKMQLEQVAKELLILARRGELGPSHHQRARMLMRELRIMGMTNAQISKLTHDRWAETTIKEYTREVTVMNSEPWQSTTALLAEMLSRGLTTGDVKQTIAVRDKLESGGTSFDEIIDFLSQLKGAGMDVHPLVELYGEWKSSGLTGPDIAAALKYKGEIEAGGFGLGSLSDIAGAAQALGSPEEVLRAIGKYQDIEELDEQLHPAQRRLADEESKVKERIEEGEQAIREAEERERSTRNRLSQLDQEVNAKVELLTQAEELEKLELNAARLGDLYATVTTIGAKYGLGREEVLGKFFDELKEYDAALGFEAEARARKRLSELVNAVWPVWFDQNIEPRIAELERNANENAFALLKGPWTFTCNQCGTTFSDELTSFEIEELLARGQVQIECINPACEDNFLFFSRRHRFQVSLHDLVEVYIRRE